MNRPLLWIAAGYALGTFVAAGNWTFSLAGPAAAMCLAVAAVVIAPRRVSVRIASVILAFAASASIVWMIRNPRMPGDALSRYVAETQQETRLMLRGTVRSAGLVLPNTEYASFVLDVTEAYADEKPLGLTGRTLVRWRKPEAPIFLSEELTVRGSPKLEFGRVNPGISGVEDYYRLRDVHTALDVSEPSAISRDPRKPFWSPFYWASRLRQLEAQALCAAVPNSSLDFVLAVWLGDRARLENDEYQSYVVAGTAHILSVSGVHLTIIYASASMILRGLMRSRRKRAVCLIGVITLYAFTTGAQVATLRSALMVAIYLVGDLMDREPDTISTLSLSALLFMIVSPNLVFDASAQLSFLSVASILLFGDWTHDRLGFIPRPARSALSTAAAVQILPLPLAIHLFHVLPLLSPLTNLIVVPLLALVLWLSFAVCVVAMVSEQAALIFGHAIQPLAMMIDGVNSISSVVPGAFLRFTSPSPPSVAIYIVASLLLYFGSRHPAHRRKSFISATGCLLLAILLWRPFTVDAKIVFLDVGHGDATFVRTPGGTTLLVDGGDRNQYIDQGAQVIAPFLWSEHVSHIDHIIATHPDRDHIGGLLYVIRHISVGELILGPIDTKHSLENELIEACNQREIPVLRVFQGDTIPARLAKVEVLHPPRDWSSGSVNDESLVLRVSWAGHSVLLTGDIEAPAEALVAKTDCHADILKIPHHGSNTSSRPEFIAAVQPAQAVASTGEFKGEPLYRPEIRQRYRDAGVQQWRTDHHGGVTIRFDGPNILISGARIERGFPIRTGMP